MLGAESLSPRAESYAGIVFGIADILEASTVAGWFAGNRQRRLADQYVRPSRRSLTCDLITSSPFAKPSHQDRLFTDAPSGGLLNNEKGQRRRTFDFDRVVAEDELPPRVRSPSCRSNVKIL